MSLQQQFLYADFITLVAALIILLVALWYIERQNEKKKVCVCAHKPERHKFKIGKCWDCKCHEFILDWRL